MLLFQTGQRLEQGGNPIRGPREQRQFIGKAGVVNISGQAVLDRLHQREDSRRSEIDQVHADGALHGLRRNGLHDRPVLAQAGREGIEFQLGLAVGGAERLPLPGGAGSGPRPSSTFGMIAADVTGTLPIS